jgi:SIR2-like protein
VRGRSVVPFLGAGVNLFERPENRPWKAGEHLPNALELANYLTEVFYYPPNAEASDLLRVSQYIAATQGPGALYQELHKLFAAEYQWSALHKLVAELPSLLAQIPGARRHQLILTTNYDDALERAFTHAKEPYDVVSYVADDAKNSGKFVHWPYGATTPEVIRKPNTYKDVSCDTRTVILKLHGAVDRLQRPPRDSYVITEDHYVDYLTRVDVKKLMPVLLAEQLTESHILFLGYSMKDWNLRVLLHNLWRQEVLRFESWSIQANVSPLDEAFWKKRNLTLVEMDLMLYVPLLRGLLESELSTDDVE